ncbi:MAG: hypothetical protein GY794_00870 [bacterium]|nr:hypothetical protein [bacterium]
MKLSEINSSPDREFTRLGQIAYDDKLILVLDGDYIIERIGRSAITSARIEIRPSFKHPIIGAIVGTMCVAVPASAILGDPLGIKWMLAYSIFTISSAIFLPFMGLLLYFPAICNRKIEWLVFDTTYGYGQRAFPLKCEARDEIVEFIENLGTT